MNYDSTSTNFDDLFWQNLKARQQAYAGERWSYWLADTQKTYHRPKTWAEAALGGLTGQFEHRLSVNQLLHRLEPYKKTWWLPLFYVNYLREMSHWSKARQEAEINRLIKISKGSN